MNLNFLVDKYISDNNRSGVQTCIEYSLDPIKTLESIRDSQRYNLLKDVLDWITKLGLINKNRRKCNNEQIEEICAEIYIDNDEGYNLPFDLKKYIDISYEVQSLIMGRKGIYLADFNHIDIYSYIIGTIQGKRIESFKRVYDEYSRLYSDNFQRNKDEIASEIGRHGTTQFTDYFGYDEETVLAYFYGIHDNNNKILLNQLLQMPELMNILEKLVNDLLSTNKTHNLPDSDIGFYSWLRNFIHIYDDTKEYMRKNNKKMFRRLYTDNV